MIIAKRLGERTRRLARSPTFLAGRRFQCPCCGRRFRRFLPGPDGRAGAACPGCGSLERHRLMALLIRAWLPEGEPRDILHFAPEPGIRRILAERSNVRYVGADLSPEPGDLEVDIMRIPFADSSFDLVVCSHVLEHVADDRRAMREIRRVLRPTGTALLQHPVNYRLDQTVEDPEVTDPLERWQKFGQPDHLRFYATDLAERLRSAGLRVGAVHHASDLAPEVRARHRLDEPWGEAGSASDIYRCERDEGGV